MKCDSTNPVRILRSADTYSRAMRMVVPCGESPTTTSVASRLAPAKMATPVAPRAAISAAARRPQPAVSPSHGACSTGSSRTSAVASVGAYTS